MNQETTSDVVVSTMFDVKTTCVKLLLNITFYLQVVSMNQFSNMGLDFQYFSSYSYPNFNSEFLVRTSHLHGDDHRLNNNNNNNIIKSMVMTIL